MSKKFISFIAPVYNVNLYLDDFFASFKNLPKDQYEIIVVNDDSPENPEKIIAKWNSLINIKYIKNKKNIGVGFSRNVAIKNMSKKTTHFMIIDTDDRLSPKAWNQIVNAKDNIVYVSKMYTAFNKFKSHDKQTWKNNGFVGSGVLSAWGNLIPVSKSHIQFTSRSFEDFRWMAQITKNSKFLFFDDVIVEYRYRASSIMNTPYNSRRRAEFIIEHSEELKRAHDDKLIKDDKVFLNDMKNLYVVFSYISKSNKKGLLFNTKYFTKREICKIKLIALLQKSVKFWWWNTLFFRRKAYK